MRALDSIDKVTPVTLHGTAGRWHASTRQVRQAGAALLGQSECARALRLVAALGTAPAGLAVVGDSWRWIV